MQSKLSETILGVDPGLNITGYAVIRIEGSQPSVVEAGVIRAGSERRLDVRLANLHQGITDVIRTYSPNILAIEDLYSHYERPKTAILMGHARGVICLAGAQANIPLAHYAATKIKRMLTGNGRASKTQVQLSICRQLRLKVVPDPPDVADALAIAMCHFFHRQMKTLTP
jgi:crossover junction endodeoxyribonuclease RuvC